MGLLATESANTLGTAALTGRTVDNVNGGTEAFVWGIFSGGAASAGDGAGLLNFGPTSMSIVRDARIRKERVYFDPLSGTSGPMLTAFARNDASNLGARRIALLWASGQTSLRLAEIATVGGSLTNRATKTTTAPGAPVWLEIDATTGTTVYARVFASDGTTLLHEISYEFPSLPAGDGWGFGGYQNGNTGKFDNISFWDGPVATPPILGTPTATSTGASSASATVSTDKASGTLYALFSSATPDDATIIGTGTASAVTAAGTQNVALSGLPQASTGKVHVVHVLPTLERSNVARSNTITLNNPMPVPNTTVVTAMGSVEGQLAVIVSGVATNTASVSVSLPAAATPNGAVTRPSQTTVPDGAGNWSVAFVNPPPGTYAPATIILSNEDNPVVNKSGERGVDIIPIEGSDTPEGGEVPDVPVAFSGPVPAQSATVGSAFSVSLAGFFTGTRVPFTYALLSGSLAGSGLALSGSTISGTPTTATTLAGLVVRATDADGATADTNAFGIAIAAAGDTTAPVMSGVITASAVTSTSHTTSWPPATDNVAVAGYEHSVNGGTTYTDIGQVLSRAVTGRTPGATDQVRVRAYDAATPRNYSAPLSLAVVLLGTPPVLPPGPGQRLPASKAWFFDMLARAAQ